MGEIISKNTQWQGNNPGKIPSQANFTHSVIVTTRAQRIKSKPDALDQPRHTVRGIAVMNQDMALFSLCQQQLTVGAGEQQSPPTATRIVIQRHLNGASGVVGVERNKASGSNGAPERYCIGHCDLKSCKDVTIRRGPNNMQQLIWREKHLEI